MAGEFLGQLLLFSPPSPLLQWGAHIMFSSVVVSLSLILFGLKLPNQGKGMFLGLSVHVKASAMGGL